MLRGSLMAVQSVRLFPAAKQRDAGVSSARRKGALFDLRTGKEIRRLQAALAAAISKRMTSH